MIIEITHFVNKEPICGPERQSNIFKNTQQARSRTSIDTKVPIFLQSCLLKFLFHIHPIPCNMQELAANHTGSHQGK